jgi:hypothetical protein
LFDVLFHIYGNNYEANFPHSSPARLRRENISGHKIGGDNKNSSPPPPSLFPILHSITAFLKLVSMAAVAEGGFTELAVAHTQ